MTVKQKTPAVFDDDEIKVALTLIHGAGAHPLIPAGLSWTIRWRVHRELSDHRQEALLLDIKQQRREENVSPASSAVRWSKAYRMWARNFDQEFNSWLFKLAAALIDYWMSNCLQEQSISHWRHNILPNLSFCKRQPITTPSPKPLSCLLQSCFSTSFDW